MKNWQFLFLIPFVLLTWCWEKELWQWVNYPNWLYEWWEVYWPTFDNFEWCKSWAINKYEQHEEAYCTKNCHDSVDWNPICEDVVRTRQPIPWFWNVFEWLPEREENIENPNCREPFNDYDYWSEWYLWFSYGLAWWICDYSQPLTKFNDACNYWKHEIIRYISCIAGCNIPNNPYDYTDDRYLWYDHAILWYGLEWEHAALWVEPTSEYIAWFQIFHTIHENYVECMLNYLQSN